MLNSELAKEEMERVALLYAACVSMYVHACVLSIRAPCDFKG